MINYAKNHQHSAVTGLRGGVGTLDMLRFLRPEQTGDKIGLFGVITLEPGTSIGVHAHTDNAELCMVMEGELVCTENGKEYVLHEGDVTYTANGDAHGNENRSDKPVKLLAVVVK